MGVVFSMEDHFEGWRSIKITFCVGGGGAHEKIQTIDNLLGDGGFMLTGVVCAKPRNWCTI